MTAWKGLVGLEGLDVISIINGVWYVRALTLSMWMAAFRPTRTCALIYYDLYPSVKVVSCNKGAVPPLFNSFGFFWPDRFVRVLGVRRRKAELGFNSQATSYN